MFLIEFMSNYLIIFRNMSGSQPSDSVYLYNKVFQSFVLQNEEEDV